ncbi:MAG TPA: MlaD family protein [Nevskia sp.]|nr:MlaD family protein [Nevskia sp.]
MTDPDFHELPEPERKPRHRWSVSLIWLVPIAAAVAGLVLVVRTYLEEGPTISISFETAEGLEAGKTEVRYKNVVVGKVRRINMSRDHSQVIARVDLTKEASDIAVADSRFWVERPRVGISGVSGIETLVSGAYIGVDIGTSGEHKTQFTGLEKPPPVTHDMKGKLFMLHTTDAGSLGIGSPVYYHRISVGKVVDSDLDPDGKHVTVQIFVDAPNDRLVTENSRFWNASGVDLSLNASGLKVNTQSLATVIAGGVAFQPFQEDEPGGPAADKADFYLFSDQSSALAPPDGPAVAILMHFQQTVRGLNNGAQIDFHGIAFGAVKAIQLQFDKQRKEFYTDVLADVYPDRLGAAMKSMRELEKSSNITAAQMWERMIERGLRAQLRSGNIITGQLYIALDFVKNPRPVLFDSSAKPLVIPTAPGSMEELQEQIQNIVKKLNEIPFGQIGNNLNSTLRNASQLLAQLDKELVPEAKATLHEAQGALRSLNQGLASPDSPLQQNAQRTLEEVNRAAASFRALADYLEQHPESLIRGKSAEQEPAADSGRK